MPRISTADLDSLLNAPLGPGGVIVNMPRITPLDIEAALNGDLTKGRLLGAMTDSPSLEVSHEMQDLTENIVGINARLKGATQLQRSDATLSMELVEITADNLKVLDPTLDESTWNNPGTLAALTLGAGNAGVTYTAKTDGTAGNSVRVVHVTPTGSNAALTVTVSGNDIAVNLATGATAGVATSTAAQVRAAVNASAAASALVTATLPGDGTGLAVAQALTALSGGVAGAVVGKRFRNRGFITQGAYLTNAVMVLENLNTRVFFAIAAYNCISLDDTEYQFDDEGNVSGIGLELMAHSGPESLNASTGNYLAPYEMFLLNQPVAV